MYTIAIIIYSHLLFFVVVVFFFVFSAVGARIGLVGTNG